MAQMRRYKTRSRFHGFMCELDQALLQAVDDPEIRVIIIAGAGKHFSAGYDLGSAEKLEDQLLHPWGPGFAEEYQRLSRLYFENTLRWRDQPKANLAQVQGYCIMGGLMLASACDLIVAVEDALFADRAAPRVALEAETMALAQKIATNDPFAMKMAKLSVNETMDAQGQRDALERSFKNYMLTIPHRQEQGTYGAAARANSPKERFAVLNAKPGRAASEE